MGIFDWFRPAADDVDQRSNQIWLTQEAKFAGIVRYVRESVSKADAPLATLVIAHFSDTLEAAKQRLASEGLIDSRIVVVAADKLRGTFNAGPLGPEYRLDLVVVERHPLTKHDEAVLEFARSLHCPCRLAYHVSLEDPVMRTFGGAWVSTVLTRLGMKDDESIESSVVDRSLKKSQDKQAARATADLPARSAEEWFKLNYPNQ